MHRHRPKHSRALPRGAALPRAEREAGAERHALAFHTGARVDVLARGGRRHRVHAGVHRGEQYLRVELGGCEQWLHCSSNTLIAATDPLLSFRCVCAPKIDCGLHRESLRCGEILTGQRSAALACPLSARFFRLLTHCALSVFFVDPRLHRVRRPARQLAAAGPREARARPHAADARGPDGRDHRLGVRRAQVHF